MSDNYQLLDCNGLKTHFAGDEEMIGELVEVFAETYPDILSELKKSIVEKDFEVIERSAHSLKGMVANFFSEVIKEDCFAIEKMGKEKVLDNIEEHLLNIEANIPQLLQEIKLFLDGGM